MLIFFFFFSSRRRHTRCALVTGVQTCALPISVGEPINPEAWLWYHRVPGEGRCPIIDTWWQTETGAAMIAPFPGATDLKPGSATKPFFGVALEIVDAEGKEIGRAHV